MRYVISVKGQRRRKILEGSTPVLRTVRYIAHDSIGRSGGALRLPLRSGLGEINEIYSILPSQIQCPHLPLNLFEGLGSPPG